MASQSRICRSSNVSAIIILLILMQLMGIVLASSTADFSVKSEAVLSGKDYDKAAFGLQKDDDVLVKATSTKPVDLYIISNDQYWTNYLSYNYTGDFSAKDVTIKADDSYQYSMAFLLSKNDQATVTVTSSKSVDVYIMTSAQKSNYNTHQTFSTFMKKLNATSISLTFTIPDDQYYYLVVDNNDYNIPGEAYPEGPVVVDISIVQKITATFTPFAKQLNATNLEIRFTVPDDQVYFVVVDNTYKGYPGEAKPTGDVIVDVSLEVKNSPSTNDLFGGLAICFGLIILVIIIVVVIIILIVYFVVRKKKNPAPQQPVYQQPYQQPYYQQPPPQQPYYQPPPSPPQQQYQYPPQQQPPQYPPQ